MWRAIIVLAIVAFAVYRIYDGVMRYSMPGYGAPPRVTRDGYAETRFVLSPAPPKMPGPVKNAVKAAAKDGLEMVVLEERPDAEACDKRDGQARAASVCPEGFRCTVKSFECKTEIAPRYRKMLDREPASVRYTHFERDEPGVKGATQRYVMFGWGLTEALSVSICDSVVDPDFEDVEFPPENVQKIVSKRYGRVTCH